MKTLFSKKRILYDGSQLSERWIYKTFGILGDACVSFIGGCDVEPLYMVDLEDVAHGNTIQAKTMLHFIAEIFSLPRESCVLFQRLFITIIKDILERMTGKYFRREGDDLYLNEKKKKLNVSIATPATISFLVHVGINVDGKDTPVPVVSLNELGISPHLFAKNVLKALSSEFDSIIKALYKVNPK